MSGEEMYVGLKVESSLQRLGNAYRKERFVIFTARRYA